MRRVRRDPARLVLPDDGPVVLPGEYTLLLSADDGVHAVAYDAVVVKDRKSVV